MTHPPAPHLYTDAHQSLSLRETLVQFRAGGLVLDYGCGVGRVSRALLLAGCDVLAVDVSPSMLEYTEEYCAGVGGPRLVTMLTDGFGVPSVVSGSVDGVLVLYCLQHMQTFDMVDRVLADLVRVLKKGGWLVVQFTPHETYPDGGFVGVSLDEDIVREMVLIKLVGTTRSAAGEVVMRFVK